MHVFVPFIPKGELLGVVYMKLSPDISHFRKIIANSYDESSAVFSGLILLGLLGMFYITSYTVRERDLAQEQLFQQKEKQIKREIEHQKEALFTRRIYHAHHKAEKVMGFIKEDINALDEGNVKNSRYRIMKYANFVARVIYDMKWYDPPIHVVRNPMFRTNINEVIEFIVKNVFGRVYHSGSSYRFRLDLDSAFPVVSVNEYVVWEIIEPLIQNCLDHNPMGDVTITIRTEHRPSEKVSTIMIEDDGCGIDETLLQTDSAGIQKIFLEHTSTKEQPQNSGYGCYLAHEISTRRCGWLLDAENLSGGGARFVLSIRHS